MQYSASDFRTMARDALRGKWKTAILVTILAAALGVTTAGLEIEFEFESEMGLVLTLWEEISFTILQPGVLSAVLAVVTIIVSIILLILSGAISLGYYQFHQNLVRGEEAEVRTLFVHMDKIWHGICLNFLQFVYILLWTLCLLIPGIMASYSYAMTSYIANDHPEMTANEAITASKEMMKGHRWRLFCLEISFIGWSLLAILTLGIGSFAVVPYCETARAFFYQDLVNAGMKLEDNIYNAGQEDTIL